MLNWTGNFSAVMSSAVILFIKKSPCEMEFFMDHWKDLTA